MNELEVQMTSGAQLPESANEANLGDEARVNVGGEGNGKTAESKNEDAAKGDATPTERPVCAHELVLVRDTETAMIAEKAQTAGLEEGTQPGNMGKVVSLDQVSEPILEQTQKGVGGEKGGAGTRKEAETAGEKEKEGQKAVTEGMKQSKGQDGGEAGETGAMVDGLGRKGAGKLAEGDDKAPGAKSVDGVPVLVGSPVAGDVRPTGEGAAMGEKGGQSVEGRALNVTEPNAEKLDTRQSGEPRTGEDQNIPERFDAALPNAPGSGGYLARSHPSFNRSKSFSQPEEIPDAAKERPSEGDVLLNLVHDMGPGKVLPLAGADQPDAATWQQQLLALGGGGVAAGALVRKSEGLSQDLNLTWGNVREADQASEEVTKNLEAQLKVLQKVAATRFGDAAGARGKDSHEETMRKLKAELASLEQRAAAQNLAKKGGQSFRGRGRGFAELRMAPPIAGPLVLMSAEAAGGSPEEAARERGEKRARKRRRPNGSYNCQVEGCQENLEHAKAYNKRHHVCWVHSRAWEVLIHGVLSRFCQQCSRFHDVRAFDEIKRSCRERLLHHNKRRRTISDAADAAKGSGDVSEKEKEPLPSVKESADKAQRSWPPSQDPPPRSAAEPDPLARALNTLMKAQEQLGTGPVDLSQPPPNQSNAPGPPQGTYETSPASKLGANPPPNPATPTRHNSTELTLSSRSSGFEVLDQMTGRGVNMLPLGRSPGQSFQSPGGQQHTSATMSWQLGSVPTGFESLLQTPPRPENAAGAMDRAHSPFLDVLMRSQHALRDAFPQKGLELTQRRFSLDTSLQKLGFDLTQQRFSQDAERAHLEGPNDLASEVGIRSPLLAAYVPGYDVTRAARGGGNGAANSSLRGPTYNMLTEFIGGGQRAGGTLPLGFGERDAGGGPLKHGLRDHSAAHADSLLRLMTSHAEAPAAAAAAPVKDPANHLDNPNGHFGLYGLPSQAPREQPLPWLGGEDQREQTAALHREFQMLIQSQTRAPDLGSSQTHGTEFNGGPAGGQAPFPGLPAQIGFQGQEPGLGNRSFNLNNWTFN